MYTFHKDTFPMTSVSRTNGGQATFQMNIAPIISIFTAGIVTNVVLIATFFKRFESLLWQDIRIPLTKLKKHVSIQCWFHNL